MGPPSSNAMTKRTWIPYVAATVLGAGAALAQSITIESDRVTVQDATDATRVDVGPQVIVEGEETRVLGPGPDIQALIDAATGGSTKPHLIRLGPGVYDLAAGLVMKPYVSLVGSGEDATLLRAATAIENLVQGANDMAISDLTIWNHGGHASSKAIFNLLASPRITRVTAEASGAQGYAIYNDSSSPVMSYVTANALGTTDGYGVYNTASSPVMTRVTASATGATADNYGVYNLSASSPLMNGVTTTASGGVTNIGVRNDSSSPTMTGVTATASGAGSNYAVYNDSSSPTMTGVSASASGVSVLNCGVFNDGSAPRMTDVETSSSDGTVNYGVFNGNSSSPIMVRVRATASGGDLSYGVRNDSSEARIYSSLARARNGNLVSAGIDGINLDTRVYNTQVVGGIINDASGTQCQNVYDDTPAAVGC